MPNIQYYRAIVNNGGACIEQWESFPKQSYRNRCQIQTQSGPMALSIPVIKANSKQLSKDVRISYHENWQAKHWHAIVSAYNSSPYFEYFRDDFERFYREKFDFLIDYNRESTNLILDILGIKADITFTSDYIKAESCPEMEITDLRDSIHPKVEQVEGCNYFTKAPYPQVFDSRLPFEPNLSIIDLVFNIGEESRYYLKKQ